LQVALGLETPLLLGGSFDCDHVEIGIHSVGVA
jgi:hypothetical protein